MWAAGDRPGALQQAREASQQAAGDQSARYVLALMLAEQGDVAAATAALRTVIAGTSDAALRELQNRHEFHLCLSQTEGWGHYIPEAESVGAVVLATDAAPMNELVGPERGMLIASSPIDRQHLAVTHAFDEDDLEQAVTVAIGLEASARERLGTAARAWFLQNKRTFPERLAAALALVHDA